MLLFVTALSLVKILAQKVPEEISQINARLFQSHRSGVAICGFPF